MKASTDEQKQTVPHEQEDVMARSSVENVPEDDVLVEENVTPFYMNSGNVFN